MFEITIERQFSAAHAIRLYDGSLEPVHGHNWSVRVTVGRDELDEIEVVTDFHDLENQLNALITRADNNNLNAITPFCDGAGGLAVNPTAERVAWWIGAQVAKHLANKVRLVSVEVGEAPGCTATYRP